MGKQFEGRGKRFRFMVRFPFMAAVFILVGGLVVMFLWNNIIPAVIPSAKTLTYAQAVGLLVLSRILFGGFRGGPHGPFGRGDFRGGPPFGGRHHFGGDPEWREKVMNMTDEEREKFRAEWRERWHKR